MTSLEMATTDELWDELKSRYVACLFAYVKECKANDDKAVYAIRWKGGDAGIVAAYGLVEVAKRHINEVLDSFDSDDEGV